MRKRKGVLIIVLILVILLIGGGVFAFLYLTTDLFKSDEELFWKYFAQNEDIFTVFENDKYELQSQFKQTNSYTSSGNFSLLVEQGESSSKQLDIETTSRHDVTTGRTYADATLKNGDIDLFQVSYINSDDIYAIKCEEVYGNYVGIRNSGLTELAANYGITSTFDIPDSISFEDDSGLFDITDEQKQHILDTYLPIIQSGAETSISASNMKSQVTVNGTTYEANQYILQLTGEDAKQIIIDCLNSMKSDTETLVLISNKLSALGFGTEYTDTSNLSSIIDEMISEIQQMDMEDAINITVFASDGETVRTVISMGDLFTITYDRAGGNPTLTIDIYQTSTSTIGEIEDTNILASANYISSSDSINTTEDNTSTEENVVSNDENTIDNDIATDGNQITNEVTEGNDTQTSDEISSAIDMSDDDILDIGSELTTSTTVTSIVISKTTTDNMTTNSIQIIPDDNYPDTNINITYSLSSVQNNSINNSYSIVVNNADDYSTGTITIAYNTSIVATDQVEEIEELTNSNTAIANNYSAEEFTTFMTSWIALFNQAFSEKLSVIGF